MHVACCGFQVYMSLNPAISALERSLSLSFSVSLNHSLHIHRLFTVVAVCWLFFLLERKKEKKETCALKGL